MAESGLVTVLFTDLVGSTELSERIGDGAADDLRLFQRQVPIEDVRVVGPALEPLQDRAAARWRKRTL